MDTRKPGIYIYGELKFYYEPFYVGKGYGHRAYEHMSEKRIVNTHKSGKINKIKKCGLPPEIKFIFENISDDYAKIMEIQIIDTIGIFVYNI